MEDREDFPCIKMPFITYEVKNKFGESEAQRAIERIKDFEISRLG
ncbi:hypothetical protein [Acidianus sp. HS-5]|nr:hypothetical protein [Acidianus sp. HS-5]